MRLLAVHVCPLWEEPDGTRRPGMRPKTPTPRTVGWVCVGVFRWLGMELELLLTKDAA